MKKKVLAMLMVCAMAGTLAACGSSSSSSASSAESSGETSTSSASADSASGSASTADGETYVIGICQYTQHPALDAATQGFEDACTELFGEGNVTFDLQNASTDTNNCSTIANQFVTEKVDLIMANATPPLAAAAAATDTIPILGTSVTDYATALQISDWTGTTGTNISGTSDLAPLDQQAAMLHDLFPDASTVGILYCSGEPNSLYQSKVITPYLESYGYTVKEYTFSDSNDVASVAQSALSENDVVYIPTDNTAASCTEAINNTNMSLSTPKPIIAGEEGICSGCGVATLSIDYYSLGYKTGEMAYDVLVNGEDISTMEIETADEVTYEYNATVCEALGITVPDNYVAIEE